MRGLGRLGCVNRTKLRCVGHERMSELARDTVSGH